ncbi:MAG: phosphoribosylaminoimidazolesuccinocarboxamide synthase [Candidatus Marinimicrobia bacterium]|jgi:phosphoribosylaminoimidazole-succinocarboxamide synthase|nr:phosphoribosylaminoimidazolesuccinocarboxamide synthase [Candidatus Neomarinimicrobiota bacterium]MBT7424176.1 phosphoribosylaminoimidazolesuccinocarboxamide synthase [Candidatus Neomarinimicrobiota bacterium]
MNVMKSTEKYKERIKAELNNTLTETTLERGEKRTGKVRDQYSLGDKIALITTDRQSAFDRVLASIPFKGQVLNLTSAWWFEQTKDIIPNQVINIPDPNITLAKNCEVFPIEFVVRGYITGSTSTSLWTVYNNGDREYCGNILSEGLVKNQKLDSNMLTPTTKEEHHDRPIAPNDIVREGWMTQTDWEYCSQKALELFEYGQKKAAENGMILVDTKYEMGKAENGEIVLIDEIHTPDSSRYWIAETYNERMASGNEPQNIDKEFLRLWFVDNCDPYNDEVLPAAPEDLIVELSSRYIYLYETITGQLFPFPETGESVIDRINKNLRNVL